jgi:hypothetical protein
LSEVEVSKAHHRTLQRGIKFALETELRIKKLLLAFTLLAVPAIALVVFPSPALAAAQSALGDLSSFHTIAADTSSGRRRGSGWCSKAHYRFRKRLRCSRTKTLRSGQDGLDSGRQGRRWAISSLRKPKPDAAKAKVAVKKLIAAFQNPAAK